jgi:hypothetical protein
MMYAIVALQVAQLVVLLVIANNQVWQARLGRR